ncbi:protein kinase [Planctomycetes bacterium K23_9]|uniref:Amino acid kinase family protein n=1 Tax=Stieleria marina TaxID=1930275 RepID=A0A517NQN6_9BACT|nr:Amino acid kinase family protein [Planctomycetes bacterium K23_9]
MRRVIKIGGSLLLRGDFPQAMHQWLARQTPAENVVIVGGGELIEAVRRRDSVRPGDAADVHWRCIDLLTTTFQTAGDWFPKWQQIDSSEGFQRCVDFGFSSSYPTLVKVASFYRRSHAQELPLDWRTTTDAIAVLLGNRSRADEVVLLKSCDVDPAWSIDQLTAQGIIDEAVPMIKQHFKTFRVEKLDA